MQIHQALGLARRLMAEHGLDGWTVVADRAKTRAGVCRFASRQIGLSGPLTELHGEAEVRDTILHEIAHALVGPEHGHDRVWRAKAREIGCSGERCLAPDAPRVPGAWVGTCPAGHRTTRHKAPQRVVTCGHCARRFDLRHLLRWTFNGAVVPMPEVYAAQLRRHLGATAQLAGEAAGEGAGPVFAVGDPVRVATPGPWEGLIGELELVAPLRCQVRLGQDLVSFPTSALEPADPVRARSRTA